MDPLLQKIARALAGGCLETVARAEGSTPQKSSTFSW